jgi:hypothetical protein
MLPTLLPHFPRPRLAVSLILLFLAGSCLAAERGVQVFADPLRAEGGPALNGREPEGAEGAWRAGKPVVLTETGATADGPAGGHHAVVPVRGTIHLQADVVAQGSGFTGIALGRGDLSGSFWENYSILFFLSPNGS